MGENFSNFYAGAPPLNRLSFHRHRTNLLNQHLEHNLTQFVVLKGGDPLIVAETKRLATLEWKDVKPVLGEGPYFDEDEKDGESIKHLQGKRTDGGLPLVFLGIDESNIPAEEQTLLVKDPHPSLNTTSPPIFALDASNASEQQLSLLKIHGDFIPARAASANLTPFEAGIFAQSKSLCDWSSRNKFCAGCGSHTFLQWGGWKLCCSSALAESSTCPSLTTLSNYCYPRTDPVLIMGIINQTGDKILLGRQKAWPKGMYSCLAGFGEPGESIEDGVRREIYEEAGVTVKEVVYHSSQPWPYPQNLMLGCYGFADDTQAIRLDLDNELEDAQWFSIEEVKSAINDPNGTVSISQSFINQNSKIGVTKDGNTELPPIRFPPTTAIAGVLIRGWAEKSAKLFAKM